MNQLTYFVSLALVLFSFNEVEAQGCLDIKIKNGKIKMEQHQYEEAIVDFRRGLECSKHSANYDLKEAIINDLIRQAEEALKDDDGDGIINGKDDCNGCPKSPQIPKHPRIPDRDRDGVPNQKDQCPNTPRGLKVNNNGCPDKDRDGIADQKDQCKETPQNTRVNFEGCPDQDDDGVRDSNDQCPDTPKDSMIKVNFRGCPDQDDDGIADQKDRCKGTPQNTKVNFEGCPDQDNDGVRDSNDKCPDTPKDSTIKVNFEGCSDQDGDGVRDLDDECPDTPINSNVNTQGCPDEDNDGISDSKDYCPKEAGKGIGSILGCPDQDQDHIKDAEDVCPDIAGLSTLSGCLAPEFQTISISKPMKYGNINLTIKEFQLSTYEITQELWLAVMGKLPKEIGEYCPRCPIIYINIKQINKFITKLSKATGDSYRLPKFSEWVYAARGGKKNHTLYSGSNQIDTIGWYRKPNIKRRLHHVGKKAPNEFKIYDMTGNVREIIVWEEKFAPPTNLNYGTVGGSFDDKIEKCRLDQITMNYIHPEDENERGRHDTGFRLVKQ